MYTRQIYKQQQAALAQEGTHELRYFEGEPLNLSVWQPGAWTSTAEHVGRQQLKL